MTFLKRKRSKHLILGLKGEKIASKLLKTKGFIILCKNYKVKSGEIDIVALDGECICFIEVKTRKNGKNVSPATGLRDKQRKRIRNAANHYMNKIDQDSLIYRFDLIEIILNQFDTLKIFHWQGNFGRNETFNF